MLLHEAFEYAHQNFPCGGICLEFGVYVGRSFLWQAQQIITRFPASSLIGFDSWQGIPDETDGVWAPDRHAKGQYQSPKNVVLDKLREANIDSDRRFCLVDGFFCDSLTPKLQQSIGKIIFVNIDVDIHKSTIEVLDFILPMLQKGTVLYFDDWKDPRDQHDGQWGEHLAWEQWTQIHTNVLHRTVSVNEKNQRYMEILGV